MASCLVALTVAGCTNRPAGNATDAQIAAVSYRDDGPKSITLFTMVNNRTGKGAHSSLLINASERIIFDPAGSFKADIVPERGDVLYGITPAVEKAYIGSHARSTFHVDIQTVEVTPAQAEIAYRLATQNGRVMGGLCSNAAANLLRQVPGFESIHASMFPSKLQEEFSRLPGVTHDKYYEYDSEDLQEGLKVNNAKLNAAAHSG
ncbi:hypothetical protein [Jhaorihella thermophila]|uniref:Lipoprotein n=1 Tax=Jhaorihella thermophila TaxID=488547 RepID=A0A1H5SAV0_9RHOB|nr:hypothetical protein [Jhaorihella thermophila]SEF46937.1 hypothetical protein SAMN05421751_101397 [Jhaorihella thermophila]